MTMGQWDNGTKGQRDKGTMALVILPHFYKYPLLILFFLSR